MGPNNCAPTLAPSGLRGFILIQHVYFEQTLHTNACQHYLTTDKCISFLNGRGFAEHHFSWLWSVSEHGRNY